ncbi:uncharacterized protein LOC125039525 isoform X2 [Penaeus chinensis]|uniref:uncharacterized protein LOC125039525 isoform X2 n=1 Tax=Penaeus chinensis TaxID=139456 RepID=UPI001FB6F36E|nr:uncharacterized protein LOC125039525 isoform X2 [Penaeus chinensis]
MEKHLTRNSGMKRHNNKNENLLRIVPSNDHAETPTSATSSYSQITKNTNVLPATGVSRGRGALLKNTMASQHVLAGVSRGRGAVLKDAVESQQVLSENRKPVGRGMTLQQRGTFMPQNLGNPYAPCSILDEVSDKLIVAVPGQCQVQKSWNTLSRAPVAYQMQQLIGDQYSDYTLGLKNNMPTRKTVNDHQKIKGLQSYKSSLNSENRDVVGNNMKSHSTGCLTSKSNRFPEAKRVVSSSNSSLDSTRSSDSAKTFGKKRNRFTKLSSVGSSVNVPSLTDGWVPLDWAPDFDSAKLYNSSEFPALN